MPRFQAHLAVTCVSGGRPQSRTGPGWEFCFLSPLCYLPNKAGRFFEKLLPTGCSCVVPPESLAADMVTLASFSGVFCHPLGICLDRPSLPSGLSSVPGPMLGRHPRRRHWSPKSCWGGGLCHRARHFSSPAAPHGGRLSKNGGDAGGAPRGLAAGPRPPSIVETRGILKNGM